MRQSLHYRESSGSSMGSAERWSRSYVLIFYSSGTRRRDRPTVIVTCGRLPWPIRVLHEKSMKVTFSSDRDHLHPPRWC